jgi:hypothetical protein
MFERLSRSWQLTRTSWGVLKRDRQLLVFPLVASVAAIVVCLAFLLGALGLWSIDGLSSREQLTPGVYLYAFAFYVSSYFVMFFFSAALVGAALIRFDGGTPTVRDGLRAARLRIVPILGYAIIAATVGMVLRAIQERVGFLGRIVTGLVGLGWTLATFLVVPVLVSSDVGPIDAVRESAGLFKKTWGESIAGRAGIGLAFGLIHVGIALVGAALIMLAALGGHPWLAILLGVALVVAELVAGLVHAALAGIYSAALYRYASQGQVGAGFDAGALQAAFAPKR